MQALNLLDEHIHVKLDPMGQITLPRYLRKKLGIGAEEEVLIYLEEGNICIERLHQK